MEVKGVARLLKNMTIKQQEITLAQLRGLKILAEFVASDARGITPVDTGRLRNSISVRKERILEKTILSVPVGTNVFYAPYVEFGTVRMGPRSFLIATLRKWQGKSAENILRNVLLGIV